MAEPNAAASVAPRLLDLCGCEGGAAAGYMRAGWHVTSVDLDKAALKRNPAHVTIRADALTYLAEHGHEYDAIHLSAPCQRWSANGANPAEQQSGSEALGDAQAKREGSQ